MRAVVLVMCAGCNSIFGLEDPIRAGTQDASDDSATTDTLVHDGSIDASLTWGPASPVFASSGTDDDPTLTADMLLMYFDRGGDIWMSSRNDVADEWDPPSKVVELSDNAAAETTPELDTTGVFITFTSNGNAAMQNDIYYSLRSNRTQAWPGTGLLPNVNSNSSDIAGSITEDTLTYVFSSNRPSGAGMYDLYITTRPNNSTSTTFDPPTMIPGLSTSGEELSAFILADGSELYFDRAGELYVSQRDANNGWGAAMPLTELNTSSAAETDAWVSPDRRHIYFARDSVLYHASR